MNLIYKIIKKIFLLLISVQLYSQPSNKWGDQGNGTYCNPVLPEDFSDLDAVKVNNDYYAISSTMQFSPGMVVLHSTDLVNWHNIGHVARDLTQINPDLNWDRMNAYGKGIWAGSIRFYKKRFWVYFGTPDDGFFMSSAKNPEGPWEPLHHLWKVSGWDDCSSFCDDDGQLYFIATNFSLDPENNKKYNIHLFRMTLDGKRLITKSDTIIHQSEGSEANKLYKINNIYYHFFSEVNDEGRVMMMGRSKNIYGPWETRQLMHVDKQKDKEPNQGALLQIATNKWCFLTHHGTGDWEGRPASLLPVNWIDGWPVIGRPGNDNIGNMVWSATKPIKSKSKRPLAIIDDFNSNKLSAQWEWNHQPRTDKWSLTEHKGFLTLHAFVPANRVNFSYTILRAGNTITQRSIRSKVNVVTIKMRINNMANGEYAGLTHFSTSSNSSFGIKQVGGSLLLVYDTNGLDTVGISIRQKTIWLRSSWNVDGINKYSYSLDGKSYNNFGGSSAMTWGSYRGDRIGIFNYNTKSENGCVEIDWFRYDYSGDL